MVRLAGLAAVTLLLAGCSAGLQANTRSMGTSIAELQRDQVLANLARVRADHNALPSQFELGAGVAKVINTTTAGADPAIALRAIAITGFALSNESTVHQEYAIAPVSSVTDLRLLQLLYRYAVHDPARHPGAPATFAALRERMAAVAGGLPNRQGGAAGAEFLNTLTNVIGELPDAPLVAPEGRCAGGAAICFLPAEGEEARRDAESRFLLWVTAVTQEVAVPRPEAPARPGATPADSVPRFTVRRRIESLVAPPSRDR